MTVYNKALAASQALHWLWWRLGGDQLTTRVNNTGDSELTAALAEYGLTPTSDPATHLEACYRAAASAARAIAASFGYKAEIAITEVGPVKNAAAEIWLKLAKDLDAKADQIRDRESDTGLADEVDALDYRITPTGRDVSEYVGDVPQ